MGGNAHHHAGFPNDLAILPYLVELTAFEKPIGYLAVMGNAQRTDRFRFPKLCLFVFRISAKGNELQRSPLFLVPPVYVEIPI
jgi:hypothetical protein